MAAPPLAPPLIPVQAYQPTPPHSIRATAALVRATYATQRTRPVAWRVRQLRALYGSVVAHEDAVLAAYARDAHRPAYEARLTDLDWVRNDVLRTARRVAAWAAPEPAEDMPFSTRVLARPVVEKVPLGAVLILAPANLPIQLGLGPLIGAIAAGCTAVLKPSDANPAIAAVLESIVKTALDQDAYRVVQGGAECAEALLDVAGSGGIGGSDHGAESVAAGQDAPLTPWGKIFFIGSARVGTIIARRAAETLTPTCLELGGRNPAFVTCAADVDLAARRLLWAKILNAGQVCCSQNYVLVERGAVARFVAAARREIALMFPHGVRPDTADFTHITTVREWKRLRDLLAGTKGEIIFGGEADEPTRFFAPTLVLLRDKNDVLMREETFGPIVTVLPYDSLVEAVRIANEVHSAPLACFPFGNDEEVAYLMNHVHSGGASINDTFYHASIPNLPFGGVGTSGHGSYHGRQSFEVFTHRRSVTRTPTWRWLDALVLNVRYPPYSAAKLKRLQAFNNLEPDFDPQGRSRTWTASAWWVDLLCREVLARSALLPSIVLLVALKSGWVQIDAWSRVLVLLGLMEAFRRVLMRLG